MNKSQNVIITVGGTMVLATDLHLYAIRWTAADPLPVPSLYRDGKRVTDAWTVHIDIVMPADPAGGNANTA
jgi:hypothetical protein